MVDPRSGRVHHCARGDRDGDTGLPVEHLGADDRPAGCAQRRDLGVVEHRRARVRRRPHVREAEPRVVRPRVLVDAATAQTIEAEIGDAAARPRRLDETADSVAGEQRVHPQTEADRERPKRATAVEGQQEREPADEVRRDDREQRVPLLVGLPHELDVAHAEIPQSAVDELRRAARGRTAEVTPLDECDGEPDVGRLGRDPCADDPAADHEQVERASGQLLQRPSSPVHRQCGFVQALAPAPSASSSRT